MSHPTLKRVKNLTIMTHRAQLKLSPSVRDKRIVSDGHLTMQAHINIMSRNTSMAHRRIGKTLSSKQDHN